MSDGWVEVQKSTFTNWVNVQLKTGGYEELPDNGVVEGLKDGVNLIRCLEVASKKSLGRYTKNPRMKVHKLENLSRALDFVQKDEGLLIVNIGAGDIESGNEKIVLGLIWTIIYHYQIQPALKAQASSMAKKGGAKDLLLEWVQQQIPEYNITNLNKDWNDGRALCALVNKIAGEPQVLPNHREMLPQSARRNASQGIEAATKYLGIPQILDPEDVTNPNLDDLSMMTYISYFRDAKRVTPDDDAVADTPEESGCKCDSSCTSSCSCDCHTTCKCDGSCSGACKCGCHNDGTHKCTNSCTDACKCSCHTCLCDGSCADSCKCFCHTACKCDSSCTDACDCACHAEERALKAAEASKQVALPPPWERAADWRVYEGEDLGGRCKIRVYSSTTTSSAVTRKNNEEMQRLFERMNVHKRPDFEPWVMVDLMTKEERDKVFAKAGARTLPMLFVDDEYVGSYDKVMELNETNDLVKILEY